MLKNHYNILYKLPALTASAMPKKLEALAKQLVTNGRMRIDADDKINFVRCPLPGKQDIFFSYRELFDRKLTNKTRNRLTQHLGEEAALEQIYYLKKEAKKSTKVPVDVEIKLARLFVQSAELQAIQLLLLEGTSIFISYNHTIRDLLDIEQFQTQGGNSGMQATGGVNRIFVSCGGDPLAKSKQTPNPSMARLMVIAAQEIAHNADMIRASNGAIISRYSAHLRNFRAKDEVATARISDLKNSTRIKDTAFKVKLAKLIAAEKTVKFYKQHNVSILRKKYANFKMWNQRKRFIKSCHASGLEFIDHINFPKKSGYLGVRVNILIDDMLFNLEPKASAYQHEDKIVEEAIICIEALARVPQQVVKWGHKATKFFYPKLYDIYYGDVIDGVTKTLQNYIQP